MPTILLKKSHKELEFLDKIFSGFDSELTDGVNKGLLKLGKNIEVMMNDDRCWDAL